MSRARAPGKLVVSGSYSVLWGAPALVTAVGRYAHADATREPVFISEEVAAAVELGFIPAPCFVDASALRCADESAGPGRTRKLGLGSSAAIVVATIAAFRGAPTDDEARRTLFRDGLAAHRRAQGGGSGLDVAASAFGGTLLFRRGSGEAPDVTRCALPEGVSVALYAARTSAITASFVAKVRAFAASAPGEFDPRMDVARRNAEAGAQASEVEALVTALDAQRSTLAGIGELAGAPIVTTEVVELAELASREHAHFGPSGAGGGDIAFWLGAEPPSLAFDARARDLGYEKLDDAPIAAPGAS